jgi:methylthioribose-1-phosphate isomerase
VAGEAGASIPQTPDHDAARRAFFRQFGRQAVSTAGQVAGMATIVNRVTGNAVASLLGLAEPPAPPPTGVLRGPDPRPGVVSAPPSAPGVRTAGAGIVGSPAGEVAAGEPVAGQPSAGQPSAGEPAAEHRFHSPYRMAGRELVVLDQRSIPDSLAEMTARRGSDVAYYLRLGALRGGALLAQVAALGLAMTALERTAETPQALDVELRRTAQALRDARPSSLLLAWGVDRMERRRASLGLEVDGATVAAALRTEAGAIAAELQSAQAAAARTLADVLAGVAAAAPGQPLGVLLHGVPGPLSGGLIGIGLTALRRLRDDGQPLRTFVTEGRPFMDGARLASWELRQAGLEHKVVPDGAVAWLMEHERIDVVLIPAEWVAANGDCGAVLGSRAVALQAVAMPGWPGVSQPAVIASAVGAAVDPATPDGRAIPAELRPARELVAYLAGVPVRASDVLLPAFDVVPAAALTAIVTEQGVVAPVTPEGMAVLWPPPLIVPPGPAAQP